MEKSDKKRILTRVLIVIAALTLLSCCFLGSTFARYVTNADGSGTVGVAKWDIGVSNATNGTVKEVEFGELSPSKAVWEDGKTRVNPCGATQAATIISNRGEVDAAVTITLGTDPTFKGADGTSVNSEFNINGIVSGAEQPSLAEAKETIIIQFAVMTSGTPGDSDWFNYSQSKSVTLKPKDSCAVYVRALWMSKDGARTNGEGVPYADLIDTWLGENVASVSVDLVLSAVQASELPTTPPPAP